jgi:hypothetical protein
MTYKINPQQFEATLALSSSKRCSHFIDKITQYEQLWGVKNAEGWLVPITPENLEYFPVWPHPEYAQKSVDENFEGYEVQEISIEEFMEYWIPLFGEDSVKLAVFPNMQWEFWVMEPKDMLECLREEMDEYD